MTHIDFRNPQHRAAFLKALGNAAQKLQAKRELERKLQDRTAGLVLLTGALSSIATVYAVDALRPATYLRYKGKTYDWS